MSTDFDKVIERHGTGAVKYDLRQTLFGTSDVSPMWVADMDFAVPDCVTQALQDRLAHPIYGYTCYQENIYQSLIDWFATRHQWDIQRDWISFAPGVVPSLFAAVLAFTKEGEGVITQSPVYFPFFSAVTANKRTIVNNPLKVVDGRYEMDFDHLEQCAQQGARLLLLCTPHNPVGRVWQASELQRVLEIARHHDLIIVSDEIHCDLAFEGHKHIMLQSLAQPGDKIITTLAPNKSFNIPGLGLSALVTPNPDVRKAIMQMFDTLHVSNTNPLSITAFEAAYRDGAEWLDELMVYLKQTRDFATEFISNHLPQIKVIPPEATYLLWLDCRNLGLADTDLNTFFIEECKLGLSPGAMFGEGGQGFMRMNIGAPKSKIESALNAIKVSIQNRFP